MNNLPRWTIYADGRRITSFNATPAVAGRELAAEQERRGDTCVKLVLVRESDVSSTTKGKTNAS